MILWWFLPSKYHEKMVKQIKFLTMIPKMMFTIDGGWWFWHSLTLFLFRRGQNQATEWWELTAGYHWLQNLNLGKCLQHDDVTCSMRIWFDWLPRIVRSYHADNTCQRDSGWMYSQPSWTCQNKRLKKCNDRPKVRLLSSFCWYSAGYQILNHFDVYIQTIWFKKPCFRRGLTVPTLW